MQWIWQGNRSVQSPRTTRHWGSVNWDRSRGAKEKKKPTGGQVKLKARKRGFKK